MSALIVWSTISNAFAGQTVDLFCTGKGTAYNNENNDAVVDFSLNADYSAIQFKTKDAISGKIFSTDINYDSNTLAAARIMQCNGHIPNKFPDGHSEIQQMFSVVCTSLDDNGAPDGLVRVYFETPVLGGGPAVSQLDVVVGKESYSVKCDYLEASLASEKYKAALN